MKLQKKEIGNFLRNLFAFQSGIFVLNSFYTRLLSLLDVNVLNEARRREKNLLHIGKLSIGTKSQRIILHKEFLLKRVSAIPMISGLESEK